MKVRKKERENREKERERERDKERLIERERERKRKRNKREKWTINSKILRSYLTRVQNWKDQPFKPLPKKRSKSDKKCGS